MRLCQQLHRVDGDVARGCRPVGGGEPQVSKIVAREEDAKKVLRNICMQGDKI